LIGGVPSNLCSDLAHNIGIPFKTPEEYFLREEARPFSRVFDPLPYLESNLSVPKDGMLVSSYH
jgi:bifunctional polynucleotide phosphatase/kinase